MIWSLVRYVPSLLKGMLCQHLNRSSPVFAILAVVWPAPSSIGWICYGLAIGQYLLIGLVASKDKALGVLQKFDEAVARQRTEIEHELAMHASARQQAATKLQDFYHASEM
jgi:hypothetical protein